MSDDHYRVYEPGEDVMVWNGRHRTRRGIVLRNSGPDLVPGHQTVITTPAGDRFTTQTINLKPNVMPPPTTAESATRLVDALLAENSEGDRAKFRKLAKEERAMKWNTEEQKKASEERAKKYDKEANSAS